MIVLIGMLVITLAVMRGQHILLRIVIALLLSFLILFVAGVANYGTWRLTLWAEYDPATRQRFTELIKTNDHQAVLAAGVLVIQQLRTNALIIQPDEMAVLPSVLVKMQPNYIRIKKNDLDLVFTDSRDKFGFCVSHTSNGWELAWCEFTSPGRAPEDWLLHPLAVQADKP